MTDIFSPVSSRTSRRSASSKFSPGSEPQPRIRPKLARALQVTIGQLNELLNDASKSAELTDQRLGDGSHGKPGNDDDDLLVRLNASRVISDVEIALMRKQIDDIRTLDRQPGAPAVLEQLNALMATMTNLLTYSLRPAVREPLASALADAGALAGWQALDIGAVDRAWRHYEMAKSAAREARSPALLAHAMGEQSYALLDVGRTQGRSTWSAKHGR